MHLKPETLKPNVKAQRLCSSESPGEGGDEISAKGGL